MRSSPLRFITPLTPAPPAAHCVDPAASTADPVGSQVAVLVLADVAANHRWWGWGRIVLGPRRLRRVPGLCFAKVLGSGYEGGFGLRPSPSCQGLFLLFTDEAAADLFLLLRKDMKTTLKEYWIGFHKEYPKDKAHE